MTDLQTTPAGQPGVSLASGAALYAAEPAAAPVQAPAAEPGCGEQAEVTCAAFRALPAAAAVLDLDGTVLVWNAAAEALLGWSEREMAGPRSLERVWPRSERSSLHDGVRAVGSWRVRMRHRSGARVPVRIRTSPLDAGGARGMVMLMEPCKRERPLPPPDAGITRMVRQREGGVEERLRAALAGARYLRALAPGERLPAIREVAAAARVSSRPVLAAFRALAAEGAVDVLGRRGTVLADEDAGPGESCEAGEWLVRTLVDAYGLQMKVPQLSELMSRWTATMPLVCACVESCDDDLLALEEDVARSWGMEPHRVRAGRGGPPLGEALRHADVVVTTAFHAAEVRRALRGTNTFVATASLHPRVRQAVSAALRKGPVTAVVADREFGARLAGLPHAHRLEVIEAGNPGAVAALDPAGAVLMTRAARQRLGGAARLLVAPNFMLVPDDPAALARIMVARNREMERKAARAARLV